MVRFNIQCPLAFPAEQFWRIRDTPSFLDFIVVDGLLKKIRVTTPEQQPDGQMTRLQHYCPANVHCPDIIRAVVGDTMFAVADEQRWIEEERPYKINFFIRPSFLKNISRTFGELIIQPFPHSQSNESQHSSNETTESEYNDNKPINEIAMMDETSNEQPQSDTQMKTSLLESTDTDSDTQDRTSPTNTNPNPSEASDTSDSSDVEPDSIDIDTYIENLAPHEKSIHIVKGTTKVSILTLGWFVERAIVHNLKCFYELYPHTIARFRQKLYKEFGEDNTKIPIEVIVDRYLEKEAEKIAQLQAEQKEMETQENQDSSTINHSEQGTDNIMDDVSQTKLATTDVADTRISNENSSGNKSPTSVGVQ